jgi:hypothetical protein
MKSFLELLELSGLYVPKWIFVVILVGFLGFLIYRGFKKVLVPKTEEYIKIKNDIMDIPQIKTKQDEAIRKSIEGDQILNDRIDRMNDKLDQIVNVLGELQEYSKQQQKNSEAQSLGVKMMLANELDKRYRRYLELGYIPDKEFDEYCETYRIYHDELGGNHTGSIKFNYVMDHLERKL